MLMGEDEGAESDTTSVDIESEPPRYHRLINAAEPPNMKNHQLNLYIKLWLIQKSCYSKVSLF